MGRWWRGWGHIYWGMGWGRERGWGWGGGGGVGGGVGLIFMGAGEGGGSGVGVGDGGDGLGKSKVRNAARKISSSVPHFGANILASLAGAARFGFVGVVFGVGWGVAGGKGFHKFFLDGINGNLAGFRIVGM